MRVHRFLAIILFVLASSRVAPAQWVPTGNLTTIPVIQDCSKTDRDIAVAQIVPGRAIFFCQNNANAINARHPRAGHFYYVHEFGHHALNSSNEKLVDCWAARQLKQAPNGDSYLRAAIEHFRSRGFEFRPRYGTMFERAERIERCANSSNVQSADDDGDDDDDGEKARSPGTQLPKFELIDNLDVFVRSALEVSLDGFAEWKGNRLGVYTSGSSSSESWLSKIKPYKGERGSCTIYKTETLNAKTTDITFSLKCGGGLTSFHEARAAVSTIANVSNPFIQGWRIDQEEQIQEIYFSATAPKAEANLMAEWRVSSSNNGLGWFSFGFYGFAEPSRPDARKNSRASNPQNRASQRALDRKPIADFTEGLLSLIREASSNFNSIKGLVVERGPNVTKYESKFCIQGLSCTIIKIPDNAVSLEVRASGPAPSGMSRLLFDDAVTKIQTTYPGWNIQELNRNNTQMKLRTTEGTNKVSLRLEVATSINISIRGPAISTTNR